MAKLKCAGCGLYGDADTYIRAGVSSYCSPACRFVKLKRRSRPRRTRSESLNQRMRKKIRTRDGECCRFCWSSKDLHVHHIVYRSQGGSDEPSNLITLCAEHHALVHSDKRRYMPLCLGVVWLTYMGKMTSVPQLERSLRQPVAS